MNDIGDYSTLPKDLRSRSDRDLLITMCTKQEAVENTLIEIKKDLRQLQTSPMCDDHEVRLVKIETTQTVAISVLAAGLTILIPVVTWLIDKVI